MAKRNRQQIQADALKVLEDHPRGIRWSDLLKLTHADDPDTPWNSVHGGIHALLTSSKDIVKVARGTYQLAKYVDAQSNAPGVDAGEASVVEVKVSDQQSIKVTEASFYESFANWLSESSFTDVEKEMKGLEWGRLYREHHSKSYDPAEVSAQVHKLYGDPYVKNRRGVFEYILGGGKYPRLLNVRLFDEATARSVYAKQTDEAKANSKSNCSLCAVGHSANQSKIWSFDEMDADHVSAWSKHGDSSVENCQMLCVTHNRAKGNR